MAVSVLNAWTANVDGVPNGVMTIGAGTGERLAILAYTAEYNEQLTEDFSIGGVAPTSEKLQFWENGASDQHVYFWWWIESAITSFTDNDIDGSFGAQTPAKHNWSFAVYDGVDQTTPVTAAGATNTSTDSLDITTTSTSNDYDVVAVSRSSANRNLTSWGTLTEQWADADDAYWTGLGHDVGGVTPITLTGDGTAADLTYAHLIINASGGGIIPQAMYHYRNHGKI